MQTLKKQPSAPLQTRLDRFLLAYRATPLESIGKSPGEAMFGRRLRTRLDLMIPRPKSEVRRRQIRAMGNQSTNHRPRGIQHNHVYTKLPHEQAWHQGEILEESQTEAKLQLTDGREVRRHMDYIRPKPVISQQDLFSEPTMQMTSDPDPVTSSEDLSQPIAVRRERRTPKPVDRFIPGL